MAPLTPAGHCLAPHRSLCVMCFAFQPFRLQPPGAPRHRFGTLPLSVTGFRFRSGLRHLAAGSPRHPAESSSLALRTGHSPSGTLHLASRRRSSGRLQAGERLLGKDFHLSDKTHLQTYCHWHRQCVPMPLACSSSMPSASKSSYDFVGVKPIVGTLYWTAFGSIRSAAGNDFASSP